MHFYSISYDGLLSLPLTTFWELSRNIDRIRADEDKRLLVLLASAIGGGGDKYFEQLKQEEGKVIEVERPPDRASFERLRAIINRSEQ